MLRISESETINRLIFLPRKESWSRRMASEFQLPASQRPPPWHQLGEDNLEGRHSLKFIASSQSPMTRFLASGPSPLANHFLNRSALEYPNWNNGPDCSKASSVASVAPTTVRPEDTDRSQTACADLKTSTSDHIQHIHGLDMSKHRACRKAEEPTPVTEAPIRTHQNNESCFLTGITTPSYGNELSQQSHGISTAVAHYTTLRVPRTRLRLNSMRQATNKAAQKYPPEKCTFCPATFTGKYATGNKKRHTRWTHHRDNQDLEKLSCRHCDKHFERPDNCRKHESNCNIWLVGNETRFSKTLKERPPLPIEQTTAQNPLPPKALPQPSPNQGSARSSTPVWDEPVLSIESDQAQHGLNELYLRHALPITTPGPCRETLIKSDASESMSPSPNSSLSDSSDIPSVPKILKMAYSKAKGKIVVNIIHHLIYQSMVACIGWASQNTGGSKTHNTDNQHSQNNSETKSTAPTLGRNSTKRTRDLSQSFNSPAGDGSEDEGWAQSQQKRQKPPTKQDELQLLACPFLKVDAARHYKCSKYLLKTIASLKQHLRREHRKPMFCAVCQMTFVEEDQKDEHIRDRTCEEKPRVDWSGVDEKQRLELEKRVSKKFTIKQQWFEVFRIVFPKLDPPKSPYMERLISEDLIQLQQLFKSDGFTILKGFYVEYEAREGRLTDEDRWNVQRMAFEDTVTAILERFQQRSQTLGPNHRMDGLERQLMPTPAPSSIESRTGDSGTSTLARDIHTRTSEQHPWSLDGPPQTGIDGLEDSGLQLDNLDELFPELTDPNFFTGFEQTNTLPYE